jgi:methoxymalonate biosynthesis protein
MGNDSTTHRLAVVGAGVMGVGIATLATGCGMPVLLLDVAEDKLRTARGRVDRQLRSARLLGKLPEDQQRGELRTSTAIGDVADATAVIESVTELPDVKAKVLAATSNAVRPGTLLTSNTSAIPIQELAAATQRPEELVGTHFMNPPYLIRAVEVVRAPATGDQAMEAVGSLLDALGCKAVVVGDGPGFVSNRILMWMINAAARLVAEGRAAPKDVDAVFQGCLGHRTGPLATADLIGLDNVVDTLRVLHDRTGDAAYQPCELLLATVQAGDLGRKTGRGFHDYADEAVNDLLEFLESRTGTSWAPDEDLFASGAVSSLFAMELVLHLEKTFAVTIGGEELKLDNFRTVRAMTSLVERLGAERP